MYVIYNTDNTFVMKKLCIKLQKKKKNLLDVDSLDK